ncbi:Glycosyl transferase family 2 [Candidatus Electrothrix aarhusensis]|jgi:glycosyltransferase involved in cell wall biosynthesis|uniref:Glycosyl transferase family 2 n=1 Tax=Candidatus Electrothrix aarhusensis TaxID=1859131 RepID=A0A3S3QR92_9BACT|nr:Glycosyl transferase family 2 [Candidatus Electrothrix aarhusensis]
MFKGLHVAVVMPAYNAEKTLTRTYQSILEQEIVDTIILVDDNSSDRTVEIAKGLEKVKVYEHSANMGYGANQKTCYKAALEAGADIIIMIHPDYQYTPKLILAMTSLIGNGLFSCVLGSRILGGNAVHDGMPIYKYISNRLLTFVENIFVGAKLSEYHTGYRAFSRQLLEKIDLSENSNDFVFDNQMLLQIIWTGESIGEVSCPTKYFAEASSINFVRSVRYGLGCVATAVQFRLAKMNLLHSPLFR